MKRLPRDAALRAAILTCMIVGLAGCPGGTPEGTAPDRPIDSLETTLQHADNAFREGDYREAQRAYEQALRVSPGHLRATSNLGTCYLRNRREKKAMALMQAHLMDHPDDVASRLVLARVLIRQGMFGGAADELRLIVRAAPDNLMGRYNLGFIDYKLRRYDQALEHLQHTIRIEPGHPEAHYTLGLVLLATRRMDEAIASLERAVAIRPRHVGARFNLANAFARSGRMKEAEEQQEIFAELSGRSKAAAEQEAQIKSSSVRAVQHLIDGRYPEALVEYQALSAAHPDHAPLYNEVGRLQLRLGLRDEALKSLRRAIALDPDLSEPHYLLASLLSDLGDRLGAARERELFTKLESVPEKPGY